MSHAFKGEKNEEELPLEPWRKGNVKWQRQSYRLTGLKLTVGFSENNIYRQLKQMTKYDITDYWASFRQQYML